MCIPVLVNSYFQIQSQGDSNVYLYSHEECTTAHVLSSPILPCGGKTKTSDLEGVVNDHKSEASLCHSLLTRWMQFAVATICSTQRHHCNKDDDEMCNKYFFLWLLYKSKNSNMRTPHSFILSFIYRRRLFNTQIDTKPTTAIAAPVIIICLISS